MQRVLLLHAGRSCLTKVPRSYSNTSVLFPAGRYIPYPDDYRIRRGIPALPFSQSEKTAARPKPGGYPKELKTIGDHIRAWRIDNNLIQKDVAKLLAVCEDTIVGWEIRGTVPTMRQMAGITKLLGYVPVVIDTSTFGGKITFHRYVQGITPKEFGALLPADASTVRDWEKGKHIPSEKKKLKILMIIKYVASPILDDLG
jgi:DNA-binding transcriptional regulator YiaG